MTDKEAMEVLAVVARECGYNDGAGFPDEADESDVESLIEYKNALEDLAARLLTGGTA